MVKRIIAVILIIIPLIIYLDLPSYNTVNPTLLGVPFFYWYQTLWLALSAILFAIAAVLLYWGESS
ncbi:hypothetical protein GCM10007981_07740 [Thermocladium modestius]|uniref:DUF3311 domain-containing protein n=2 Tax=Thermocladium modestius TaxID=62609 RepID=A0A830GUM6_9CREN|nr:hypothetical protein GCM10007981_07740 [Thermocladium modestius]